MKNSYRAALGVLLLLGFYVLGLVVVAGMLFIALIAAVYLPGLGIGIGVAAVLVAAAFVAALWRVSRQRKTPGVGTTVGPDQAPQLWALVRSLAAVVGTRPPDEIRVVPEVAAAVTEDIRWLGLQGGRRYLYLGLPLIYGITVDQLASIVAHEFGHFSHRHLRFGAIGHRGKAAVLATVGRLNPRSLAGQIFSWYATAYLRSQMSVSRLQEIEADRSAVRLSGSDAAEQALRRTPAVAAAWQFYFDGYVAQGWRLGFAPEQLFASFAHLLSARGDEIDEIVADAPTSERSPWDSHPPDAERIALFRSMAVVPARTDSRNATDLFPAFDTLAARVEAEFVDMGQRRVLSWDDFTAITRAAELRLQVEPILAEAARILGRPRATVGMVLDMIGTPQGAQLGEVLLPNATRKELRTELARPLGPLLALGAVESGVARYRHSWAGPTPLVGPPNLDLEGIAALAANPDTVGEARARLAELGITLDSSVEVAVVDQRERSLAEANAEVWTAIVNVVVDRTRSDVVVYDLGLLVLPGSRRTKMRGAKKRLSRLAFDTPLPHLLAHEQGRLIRYSEMDSVRRLRRLAPAYEIRLTGGQVVRVRWGGESESLHSNGERILKDALRSVSRRS